MTTTAPPPPPALAPLAHPPGTGRARPSGGAWTSTKAHVGNPSLQPRTGEGTIMGSPWGVAHRMQPWAKGHTTTDPQDVPG